MNENTLHHPGFLQTERELSETTITCKDKAQNVLISIYRMKAEDAGGWMVGVGCGDSYPTEILNSILAGRAQNGKPEKRRPSLNELLSQ